MSIFTRTSDIAFSLWREKKTHDKSFHVSFAICQNRIIAIAQNSEKTHTLNALNPRFDRQGIDISDEKGSCSEFRCLQIVKNRTNIPFSKIVLVTIRINRNGKLANSFPCQSCLSLIRFIRPKKTYYTNANGEFSQL